MLAVPSSRGRTAVELYEDHVGNTIGHTSRVLMRLDGSTDWPIVAVTSPRSAADHTRAGTPGAWLLNIERSTSICLCSQLPASPVRFVGPNITLFSVKRPGGAQQYYLMVSDTHHTVSAPLEGSLRQLAWAPQDEVAIFAGRFGNSWQIRKTMIRPLLDRLSVGIH
jgi:hypothetical protein